MNLPPKATKMYLCQEHFEDKYFVDSMKTRLTKFAVPFLRKAHINIISNVIIKPATYSKGPSTS